MIKGKHLVGAVILAVTCVGGVVWAAKFYYQSSSAPAGTSAMDLFRRANGSPLLGAAANPQDEGQDPSGETKPLTIRKFDDPRLGTRIVAQNGHALYYFANDSSGVSACIGNCAANWPPYTVKADASLAGARGLDQEIATIIREEGTLQVTYGSKPLYFWHNDKEEGDALGQGIGGVWFVAQP